MKVISYLLIFSLIHFISCTTSQVLLNEEASYYALTEKLKGEKVKIRIFNEQEFTGENINVKLDTTLWTQNDFNKAVGIRITADGYEKIKNWSVPTPDVNEFIVVDIGDGILNGLLIGGITGAVIGTIGGISLVGERSWTGQEIGAGIIIVTAPLGAVIGAVIGIPVGAVIGHTDQYIITAPADSTLINEYITVKISTFKPESEYVIIKWRGKNIRLSKSTVKLISTRYNEYFITIPVSVYKEKFN
jgi:outer membrane lipoprotein SlyB